MSRIPGLVVNWGTLRGYRSGSVTTGNRSIGVIDRVDRLDSVYDRLYLSRIGQFELEPHFCHTIIPRECLARHDVHVVVRESVGDVSEQVAPIEGNHLDPRALMRNISEAEVTAFYLHFMDGMMHETNRVNPPQCSSHTWLRPVEVHDMQGLCFAVHVAPPALLLLARVIGYGQAHIPDNVRMAVFIHAPRWFSAIWGVLKCARPGPARRSGGVYFSVSGGAWAAGEPARFPHRLTSPLAPALSGKGHVHTEPGSSHRRSG